MAKNIPNNDNNIKIFLRIKSKNKDEQNNDEYSNYLDISNNNKSICLCLSQENKAIFNFDQIFNEKEKQYKIFEVIGKPLCDNILEGYNSTIIFYGKKSTGKTYTLLGKSINDIQNELKEAQIDKNQIYSEYINNKGILIYCLEYIFNTLIANNKYDNFTFNISISLIEVFDNNIIDYFNIDSFENDTTKFNFDDIFKMKYFSDLNFTKIMISTTDEALYLLDQGFEIRNLLFNELTMPNINGHLIITIYIEKINKETNQKFKSSFNFVEISSTLNINKNKYNIYINKSIETFSYIINQLSDNVKRDNILFSNSILTNILKESLGGNAKTSLIVNISPYNNNILDSFQSISFSSKFTKIINNPIKNEIISDDIDYIFYNELLNKNERLKNEKNYLLNYLSNLNKNIIEKNKENAPKKINNQNQNPKKKEKEEDLKKILKDTNLINSKIEEIDNDIINKQKEKEFNFDKYNKIYLSLFKVKKNIEEKEKLINSINEKANEKELIFSNYNRELIKLDSQLTQKDFEINEIKFKNDEEINNLDKEITIKKLEINNIESTINALKEKYNNLIEQKNAKINIKNQLEIMRNNILKEKEEKLIQIEENKNKYNNTINKSEDIEQKIIDKNSEFNNIEKNLNKYVEYESNTINNFKKIYNYNNKKEIENNNKFYNIQKNFPQKEKELKQINNDIDEINKNKIKSFEQQEKLKKQMKKN